MRLLALVFVLAFSSPVCHAQTYTDSIQLHRQHYKNEFLKDSHSPLTVADTGYLRFYAADKAYRVWAKFTPANSSKSFPMPTYSGSNKNYKLYGQLHFTIKGKKLKLNVYQSLDLIKRDKKYKKYLFVPFTDKTSSHETYGGGRYMDLSTDDIVSGSVLLDFNKCYNPYCAYGKSGYSCPIPPAENHLPIEIKAGEKIFGKLVGKD